MLGEGSSVRSVPESSGALKGVLGENLYVVSQNASVFTAVCVDLAKYKQKSCEMNNYSYFPI